MGVELGIVPLYKENRDIDEFPFPEGKAGPGKYLAILVLADPSRQTGMQVIQPLQELLCLVSVDCLEG
jgi:hypothetical protein